MSHSNESSNSNFSMYDNYLLQSTNQQKYENNRRSPRGTLSNVLNSPELAEVHIQPQNLKVGRSPNLFESSPNSTSSIEYASQNLDGSPVQFKCFPGSDNIVIYDDIGRNWVLNQANDEHDEQENIIGKQSTIDNRVFEHLVIDFQFEFRL